MMARSHFLAVADEQISMIKAFWADRRIRVPILMIWVASFGGALHASVTAYYYQVNPATHSDWQYQKNRTKMPQKTGGWRSD